MPPCCSADPDVGGVFSPGWRVRQTAAMKNANSPPLFGGPDCGAGLVDRARPRSRARSARPYAPVSAALAGSSDSRNAVARARLAHSVSSTVAPPR